MITITEQFLLDERFLFYKETTNQSYEGKKHRMNMFLIENITVKDETSSKELIHISWYT